MKVSLSWLKDYISVDIEPSALADVFTMAGLEVDTVSDRYEYLDSVVTARIMEIGPHPNADKLKLCRVDAGSRQVNVVCGASNIEKGMIVPLALPGAILYDGQKIETSVIRGITSEGMLCSEAELGLGTDRKSIMILCDNLSVGEKIAKTLSLSDTVFEIDLTPNRPDCLSIIGIAREIAAFKNTQVGFYKIDIPDNSQAGNKNNISDLASVVVTAPDHCHRYAARLFEDITIDSSPRWLQDRLMSVGIRPVNNIVDVTNFVMLETGQPLHAFDFDSFKDNKIVVSLANDGDVFATLDNKKRVLSSDMLMICDAQKPVAIAGVMGGQNSEVNKTTTRVLLESAYFDPVSIRKTSKKLGLSTESSHRFERGVDPCGTVMALNRAASLISEIGCARIVDGIIDINLKPYKATSINLNVNDTNRLLGIDLDQEEIEDKLKSIEFEVKKGSNDNLIVTPPSFRVDIKRPVDLAEEVARLIGYDKIPVTYPVIPAKALQTSKQFDLRNRIRSIMTGFGFYEAINYSFVSKNACDLLNLKPDDERRNLADILNPLTSEQSVMRPSLIPGLLETMRRNISRQVKSQKIFETGRIFIKKDSSDQPEEIETLSALQTGSRVPFSWNVKEMDCDFYDIKGVAESLLGALHIYKTKKTQPVFTRMPDDLCTYTKPGHTSLIKIGNDKIGLVGEVNPDVIDNFDLKQSAFILEINLQKLYPLIPNFVHAEPLPKFPSVTRDITMIIDKDIESGSILEKIYDQQVELIENIELLDMFDGKPIPHGKKSISFRITYRSNKETLEDDKINRIHKDITDRLIEKFNAALPV